MTATRAILFFVVVLMFGAYFFGAVASDRQPCAAACVAKLEQH